MSRRALVRWIEIASWAFAALGVALPLAYRTPAFALHAGALFRWAGGSSLSDTGDERTLFLMLGITGGSIAGKWVVHALVARGPLAEGRPWARTVSLAGLAGWFVVDSSTSLALGASFNVWMVNLAPLVLVGVPLVLLTSAGRWDAERVALPATRLACFASAVFGAATGLAIAFAGETRLFDAWMHGLAATYYGGEALAGHSRRLALFFFGPIGGCTFAQFLMLAAIVRKDRESRRAARIGALSIAAWFVVDTGYGLAADGLFNLRLINLPAVAILLPPWMLLWRSCGSAP